MKEQVGVAILGCGYWGVNYVRVFNELAEAQVVAVCDQRPERLKEVARRFPTVHLTTEADAAIRMDGVDAVVVCTTATTHHALTRCCLQAGRHVLVEKPLTTVSEDAEDLTELAEAASRVLMVGHTFLYNGGIRKVKEYMQQGADTIYYLYSCRTNLGPIRQDVNALWDLAPHDVAIFNFLLDSEPQWVSAVGARVLCNCREDVGFISLGYSHNVVGHLHVSWADPHKTREVVVVGSERRIVFNDLNGVEQVRIFEKGVRAIEPEPLNYGEYRFHIRDGDILSPRVEVGEPLKNQCRHFLECITRNVRPVSGGREGQAVVRVLEAVDRSVALQGAPVAVTRGLDSRDIARDRRTALVDRRCGLRIVDSAVALNGSREEVARDGHYQRRASA
jgi:predicted dehydrogenase